MIIVVFVIGDQVCPECVAASDLQEVACGDRHCCGLLEESAVQALSRRQEDRVATARAEYGYQWVTLKATEEVYKVQRVRGILSDLVQQDNVVCWGDDANQQLQVPGKETSIWLQVPWIHPQNIHNSSLFFVFASQVVEGALLILVGHSFVFWLCNDCRLQCSCLVWRSRDGQAPRTACERV